MKSQQKNPIKSIKIIIASAIGVVLMLVTFIVVPRMLQQTPSNTKNGANTIKNNSPQIKNTDKTPQNNEPTADNKTESSIVGASITYVRNDNTSIRIGTLIEDIGSDGSCTLTMSKDNKTVIKNVGVQALASSSTCKGFSVPTTELSAGKWAIKIDISINSKEAHLSDSVKID